MRQLGNLLTINDSESRVCRCPLPIFTSLVHLCCALSSVPPKFRVFETWLQAWWCWQTNIWEQARGIRWRYFSRESGYRKQLAWFLPLSSLPGSKWDHLFLRVLWEYSKFPCQTEPTESPDLQFLNYWNFTRKRFRLNGFRNVLTRSCCLDSHEEPSLCLLVTPLRYTALKGQPPTILFTPVSKTWPCAYSKS